MKFIHLADLHIGKRINGFSMIEDQKHIFRQLLACIDEHQPDAVLICGDVYDKPIPTVEAVLLFDQLLTDLRQRNVAVLIIAGNHDSPERIGFASRIINEKGLHLAGRYQGVVQSVTLEDQWGGVDFYLLPFLKPAFVRSWFPDADIQSYDDAVGAVISTLPINPARRNVLLSHQFYIGGSHEPERSESEQISVGGVDAVQTTYLTAFDYVALGHIHGPQQITAPHIRYAGSPLKYSFSETHHNKQALLVELQEKGNLTMTPLPLQPLRDMRKIKGPLAALTSGLVAETGNREDYLHITLTDEDEIRDAIGKVRSVYPNVMTLTFENTRTLAAASLDSQPAQVEVDPTLLFSQFYQLQNGQEMTVAQQALFRELLQGGVL